MIRAIALLSATLTLSGCIADRAQMSSEMSRLGQGVAASKAAFSESIEDWNADLLGRPFADGIVSIVAGYRGEMGSFVLVPCGVATACVGDAHGRRVHLALIDDKERVRVVGLRAGHTFYLRPGGSGFVAVHGGGLAPLAWD